MVNAQRRGKLPRACSRGAVDLAQDACAYVHGPQFAVRGFDNTDLAPSLDLSSSGMGLLLWAFII
jgi:hypothetical protein